MIKIVKYAPDYKPLWDDLVRRSKNGSFLFYRDYMEYHADRFFDSSLLFFEDDVLIAVMPANTAQTILYSHGGLTFGGHRIRSKDDVVAHASAIRAVDGSLEGTGHY